MSCIIYSYMLFKGGLSYRHNAPSHFVSSLLFHFCVDAKCDDKKPSSPLHLPATVSSARRVRAATQPSAAERAYHSRAASTSGATAYCGAGRKLALREAVVALGDATDAPLLVARMLLERDSAADDGLLALVPAP